MKPLLLLMLVIAFGALATVVMASRVLLRDRASR
jgi:hypothetical protein